MKYNDIIKENCFDKNGNLISHCNKMQWWINKNLLYIYKDIVNYTYFLNSDAYMKQRLYHYMSNINSVPFCMNNTCNNTVNWHRGRYVDYCSTKCASLATTKDREDTSYSKYGVSNPSKNIEVKEKIKNTNLEKYGVENYSLTKEFKENIRNKWEENKTQWLESRKHNLTKYGYVFPFQDKTILKKSRDTFFEKYGKNSPLQVPEFLEKVKNTNLEKYGVSFYNQKDISNVFLQNRNNRDFFETKLKEKSIRELSKEFNISYSLLCQELNDLGIDIKRYSNNEFEIYSYLTNILEDTKILKQKRNIISKELDLYIPDYSIAIEHNGMYWHSDIKKDKNYHIQKTNECLEKGIQLIHIFENEWNDKNDIVKSILSSIFGKNKKIYARNCSIRKLKKSEEKIFLNKTHLQGYYPSSECYGLIHDDEIVQVMSWGKPRFNKNYDYELIRISTKLYTTVLGGSNKLFTNFIKDKRNKSIISYCDIRYFNGTVYEKLGFEYSHNTDPNYYYVDSYGIMHSRNQCQKHKLKNKLKYYDESLSEYENMINNGYYRIWDCGNKVYTFTDK